MDQTKDSGFLAYKALSVISGYSPAPNGNPHILNASSDRDTGGGKKQYQALSCLVWLLGLTLYMRASVNLNTHEKEP
jgi:hypothetical protein